MSDVFWVNRTITAPDVPDNDDNSSLSSILDLIEKALINSRDFANRHSFYTSYNLQDQVKSSKKD